MITLKEAKEITDKALYDKFGLDFKDRVKKSAARGTDFIYFPIKSCDDDYVVNAFFNLLVEQGFYVGEGVDDGEDGCFEYEISWRKGDHV
jgi:hypothetical protein